MNQCILSPLFLELFLLLGIVEPAIKDIKVVLLPVLVSSLSPENALISYKLLVMVLQVLVAQNVVVFEVLVFVLGPFDLKAKSDKF